MTHSDYFTDDEWEINQEFNRYLLANMYNDDGNALMMSRMLRKPIKFMT